jgi:hypothetical protein
MSGFKQKIFTVIADLLADSFDGIYQGDMPDNYDNTKTWLLLQSKLRSRSRTLDNDTSQEEYELYLAIISPDTQVNEEKKEEIIEVLDDYMDDQIVDITYLDDLDSDDQEQQIYVKLMQYDVIYNR